MAASANKKMEEAKRGSELTGSAKSAVKKKRNRSHFTQVQLKYLEDVFTRQQYLTRDERALLASALDMTELQIRNWFQNRRYQLRHRGINRARQVPVKVLVSSSTGQSSEDHSTWFTRLRTCRRLDPGDSSKQLKCQIELTVFIFVHELIELKTASNWKIFVRVITKWECVWLKLAKCQNQLIKIDIKSAMSYYDMHVLT